MNSVRSLVLVLATCASVAFAEWRSLGNYDTHSFLGGNELTIRSGSAILRITILAPDLVRIRLSPGGTFAPDHSWAVVKTNWPNVDAVLQEEADRLILLTPQMRLVVRKYPLRIAFLDNTGNLLNEDEP